MFHGGVLLHESGQQDPVVSKSGFNQFYWTKAKVCCLRRLMSVGSLFVGQNVLNYQKT